MLNHDRGAGTVGQQRQLSPPPPNFHAGGGSAPPSFYHCIGCCFFRTYESDHVKSVLSQFAMQISIYIFSKKLSVPYRDFAPGPP